MFPLAEARGRVVGFPGAPPARGRPAARQVRQLTRGRALPQERDPLRPPPRPRGDREAGAGGRRRGKHRRDRAPPGQLQAGRRVDGDGADGAAAAGARPPDAAPLPLLRRGRRRSGRDAARHGARDGAGLRRAGGHAAAGTGPGRRAAGIRGPARRCAELPPLPDAADPRPDSETRGRRSRPFGSSWSTRTARPNGTTPWRWSSTASTCPGRRSRA